MALHDELAELRAEVGIHVFDDPVAFRAAFDDFIPEGSATTGEVSLLVGAIATGALQRLKEQLALGAEPEMTIAVQGDLLARDRGTSESDGARWALAVLAHAIGAIPVSRIPTRPKPGPDIVSTAGRPPTGTPERPGAATALPDSVDPGPTRPIAEPAPATPPATGTDATRVVGQEPPPPSTPPDEAPPRAGRGSNPLLVGAVVVLAIVAVTALALLFLREDDGADATAEDDTSTSAGEGAEPSTDPDEKVLAQLDMSEAGKTVRLQLVVDGTDASVVLLADQDGEYVEVDRAPASCPYLDTSFDAGLEKEDGNEIFVGWQNEGNESWGEYGQVHIDEGKFILYGVDDGSCPSEY